MEKSIIQLTTKKVKDKLLSIRVTQEEHQIYKELSKKYNMPVIIRELIFDIHTKENNDSL